MSQLDRHLTTEELSALLDAQLEQKEPGIEQSGHLTTCQQCQRELAELRQTVNLLRALPQPALPRSFALPPGIIQITTTNTQTPGVPNIHILGSANRTRHHEPTRPSIGRKVLSLVGTLAAVVGILFVLSGLIALMPHRAGGGASSAATTASSAGVTRPESSSAASTANLPKASDGTTQNSGTTKQTQAPPAPDNAQTQNTTDMQPVPKQEVVKSENTPSALPFLDLSATGVRIGLGILLFIAGMMGRTLGRERRKGIKA